MGYLGQLTVVGTTGPSNPVLTGGWVVTWDVSQLPRVAYEVYHAAVKGPAGSSFEVWIDSTFYDNVARGDKNGFDPSQPMFVRPGQNIYFYYDTAAGSAPKATIFMREPIPI